MCTRSLLLRRASVTACSKSWCDSSRFSSDESNNKITSFSHPDNSVKRNKASSPFRISGGGERNQHICRICENSETTNINENCNFESFDGFAQHMSLRHNTSVIRITTKPSKNSLKTETDETKLFKMPEVPSLYSTKNEKVFGRGIVNQKLYNPSTDNMSPGKLNENCNRNCSLDPSNMHNKLIKNDECNHVKNFNTDDQHVGENIIGPRNPNVTQMKHWVSENESYLQGKKNNMRSPTDVLMGMQIDKKMEKQIPVAFTAERVTDLPTADSVENTTCVAVKGGFSHIPKEHLGVKKSVPKDINEMMERTKITGKSSIIPVRINVRGAHETTSNVIEDCGDSKDNQIDDKNVEPAYIHKVFNHMDTFKNIDLSNFCANSLSRNRNNKRFLPQYDNVKTNSCIAECKKILPPIKEQQPQMKYTNIPGISTAFCTKYSSVDLMDLGKPLQTKMLSYTDINAKLIGPNNCVKATKSDVDKQENTILVSGIQHSIGSGKRKRGRPPKKTGGLSNMNNVSEYLSKPSSKLRDSSNALVTNQNNTHSSDSSCSENTQQTQTQVMDVEINKEDTRRFAENVAKSGTAVQLLQKHLMNRKILNKINNSSQISKHTLPGSSNIGKSTHAVASRLSDRIKNHHILAKQRSEHIKKVEFLSRLGLIETSSVLNCCLLDLDKKCYNDKNGSHNFKPTKTNSKRGFSVSKSPSRKEVSLPDYDKIELPKKRRGRPPKKIPTSIKPVAYTNKPDHKITALFVPVRKNKSQTESSRSTGRTRKTSQKYSDYVCYY